MSEYNNVGSRLDLNATVASATSDTTQLKQVHVQVNFLGHCIFCLRKTKRQGAVYFTSTADSQGLNELLHVVPKAEVSTSSPSLLNTFNRIWLPLQKKSEENGEDEDPFGFLETAGGSTSNKSSVFTCLPRLCKFCAEKLEAVDKLLKELLKQMSGLRKIIQESKYGGKYAWRASEFETALANSSMEEGSILATLKFLDDLGKNSVTPKGPESSQTPCVVTQNFYQNITPKPVRLIAPKLPSILRPPQSQQAKLKPQTTATAGSHSTEETRNLNEGLPMSDEGDNTMDNYYCSEEVKSEDDDLLSSWQEDEREIPCSSVVSNEALDPLKLPGSSEMPHHQACSSKAMNKLKESAYDSNCDSDPDYIKSEEEMNSSTESDDQSEEDLHDDEDEDFCYVDDPTSKDSAKSQGNHVIMKVDEGMKTNMTFTKEPDETTGKMKYTCTIGGCGKVYITSRKKLPSGLSQHRTVVHQIYGDPTASCDFCGKIFSSRNRMQEHRRTIHEGKKRKSRAKQKSKLSPCDLCKENVPLEALLEHVRAHVGDEYVIKCPNPDCSFACSHPNSLAKHLNLNSNTCKHSIPDVETFTRPWHTCEVCGFRIEHALKFHAHLRNEHETSEKNFKCPIDGCNMQFTLKQSVTFHLPHHDLLTNYSNQMCPHCFGRFKLEDFPNHLQEKHQIQEVIKCQQCSLVFSCREHLVDHLFTHRYGDLTCDICGDEVKFHRHIKLREHYFHVHKVGEQHSCEQCGKVFISKEALKNHEMKQHSETRLEKKTGRDRKAELMCQECGVIYKTEKALREHNMKNHGTEPYGCAFCSETFTSKALQKRHERSHKGIQYKDPEFKCDVDGCGKVFKKKQQLQHHNKFRHLNLREHVCETCGKTYTYAKGLRDHKQSVHEGLRPFACDTCGDTFTTGSTLKRHKLIHTGERPFECEICGQKFRHNEVLARHLEGHKKKGADFKPSGPMKGIRKRVEKK